VISPTSAADVLKVLQSNQTNYLSSVSRQTASRSFTGHSTTNQKYEDDEGHSLEKGKKNLGCQRKDSGIVHTMTDVRRGSVLNITTPNSLFELSEEYTQDHDRLDKFQLQEQEESRRRHSMFHTESYEGEPPQRWDRRSSICAITTVHGDAEMKKAMLPHIQAPEEEGAGYKSACSASSSFSTPSGATGEMKPVQEIQLFLDTRKTQPHLLAPPTVSEADEPEEDDLLSPEEEEHMLRLVRVKQKYHRRRSSLSNFTRQPMEELMEEGDDAGGLELEVPPSSPRSPAGANEQRRNGTDITREAHTSSQLSNEEPTPGSSRAETKSRRSKSLYPGPGNIAFSGLLKLRNAVLPSSSNASGKGRAKNPLAQPSNSNPFANAGRSESIDSGFSCASSTSSFSSGSDEGEHNGRGRGRSASVMLGAMPAGLGIGESDQSSWIKSIKKLVEITKQLKVNHASNMSVTLGPAEEESTDISEEALGRKSSIAIDNVNFQGKYSGNTET